MADVKIQVSKSALLGEAQRVRTIHSNCSDSITQLGSIIRSLSGGVWQGNSQAAMEAKYEEMRPIFQQFLAQLEEYYKQMNTVAQTLPEEDQNLAQIIRSRSFI